MSDIPAPIEELLTDEEIDNIEARRGWAIGNVVLHEGGVQTQRYTDAVIELFNGEGEAGEFGGVRFIAHAGGDDIHEDYAYATAEAFADASKEDGWFVETYTDPEDPDWGQPAPR